MKDPDDIEVQTLSRSSNPSELLFGPLQMAAIMVWLGLYKFMTEQAAITAAAVGIGDGLAPMIGAIYGRHMYQMPFASQKTMEGSVVGGTLSTVLLMYVVYGLLSSFPLLTLVFLHDSLVFLGTVAGCYLYLYMMGLSLLPLRMVLTFSGIAAIVEGTAPGNLDNLTVPIAIHFSQSASVVAFLSGGSGENALVML